MKMHNVCKGCDQQQIAATLTGLLTVVVQKPGTAEAVKESDGSLNHSETSGGALDRAL